MTDTKAEQLLRELHSLLMKGNENDEGDLIFYRINYRLAETLGITNDAAAKLHSQYHESVPRKMSQGFCDRCQKVVTLIPVIYGIQASDLEAMKEKENAGRLIIGDMSQINPVSNAAMFGCRECREALPEYGCL